MKEATSAEVEVYRRFASQSLILFACRSASSGKYIFVLLGASRSQLEDAAGSNVEAPSHDHLPGLECLLLLLFLLLLLLLLAKVHSRILPRSFYYKVVSSSPLHSKQIISADRSTTIFINADRALSRGKPDDDEIYKVPIGIVGYLEAKLEKFSVVNSVIDTVARGGWIKIAPELDTGHPGHPARCYYLHCISKVLSPSQCTLSIDDYQAMLTTSQIHRVAHRLRVFYCTSCNVAIPSFDLLPD